MDKKIIILTLVICIIISSSIVLAVDSKYDKFKPKWYQSWDGARGNAFSNFFHALIPFTDYNSEIDLSQNADHLGWYNNTPFTLANWEREVCLLDLSTDITEQRDVIGTNDNPKVYSTTITATAIHTDGGFDTSYYEASWYIHPYSEGIVYRVYLEGTNVKEYLVGKKDNATGYVLVNSRTGASGYVVKNLNQTMTKIVIEYKTNESEEVKIFSTGVIKR